MSYHVNAKGETGRCRAKVSCPFGDLESEHYATQEEARAAYEAKQGSGLASAGLRRGRGRITGGFTATSYYGNCQPRPVQLEALNGVAQALETEEATQLVAACGTGKTFMHRQLLRHVMEQEGAHGAGIMLTSSIKLAQDTAEAMRPGDGALGEYGKDFVVIEVHSGVPKSGKADATVIENGAISVDRIVHQWEKAQAEGKRVVLVSTYDSVDRVQEAQARMEAAKLDLIIHDEAHNILGQQTPTVVAKDENTLTAYTGFHNSIPGALQAEHRLYSTATPIVREVAGDKEAVADLEEAVRIAGTMKGEKPDQYARVTVYSDDEKFVGRMSGFISQEAAVESACLAKPVYALRESALQGNLREFKDPAVLPDGTVVERSSLPADANPLTPQTYGALQATLESLVQDPQEGANGSNNVLAYVGAIPQTKAFRDSFQAAALAQSGGMGLVRAKALVDSEDPVLRRQARMRLLAAEAEVKAAHSLWEGRAEKEEAFKMFHGHDAKEGPWSPRKKVLANVDIFSEGVSINEIDTVVISDDEKLSERAMTQAIGRASRVVPGNSYKSVGHVVVPEVVDSTGRSVNAASVDLAAYGATRVERAVTANRLKGEKLLADDSTTFRRYRGPEELSPVKARERAQAAVRDLTLVATANELTNTRTRLMAKDATFKDKSPEEQYEAVTEDLKRRIEELEAKGPKSRRYGDLPVLRRVQQSFAAASPQEVKEWGRSGRVLASALATGDTSSINQDVARRLLDAGVLQYKAVTAKPVVPLERQREVLQANWDVVAPTLITTAGTVSESHKLAREALPETVINAKGIGGQAMMYVRGMKAPSPQLQEVLSNSARYLADDNFVRNAYFTMAQEERPQALSMAVKKEGLLSSIASAEAERIAAEQAGAASGELAYEVNPAMVRKNGELKNAAVKRLLYREVW